MSISDTPTAGQDAVATAISVLIEISNGVAESAATGQMLLCPFEEFFAASTEKHDMDAAGITNDDVTSMFTVRRMLDSYIRAATEHIRAAALLLGTGGTTPLLSIAALSRISCEASGFAFWLSDSDIGWNIRLKRCNQLQFLMIEEALKGSKGFADLFPTDWVQRRTAELRAERIAVIEWAKQRNWDSRGRAPSFSNWSDDVPSLTQLMRDLVESSGEPAEMGQMLYSVGSGAVHSNPILVDRAVYELTPSARQYSAVLKIKTALRCYRLLRLRIEQWTGWESETEWFTTVEQIGQVLLEPYLRELPYLPLPMEEIQEYMQHLSAAFETVWNRSGEIL